MPTACINHPDCRVSLQSERLQVHGRTGQSEREELLREIPLRDLDRVILTESVQVTSAAMAALLRAGIPVSYLAWNGQFLGSFLPAMKAHGMARMQQYRRTSDAGFAMTMAGRIVTAKLYNQRRVLQRLAANREEGDDSCEAPARIEPPDPALVAAQQRLEALFGSLKQSRSVDELRGYEGAATACYFEAWACFLPRSFPFVRRSTRPPLNPVNACISFGATLLYTEAVAFVHAHGLDPALGVLHATEDGRWSLALDLIEPFRPVLVEALALDLFTHQILHTHHFEPRQGGVYLNEEGRKRFFLQYERRMERQFMSECVGHRTTLRQQLEAQVTMYKAALEDPDRFEPFLIN